MNIIAERITQRRKELGMTQRELAEKLNVSDKTVSRWETGKQIPDALMIPEIAMALSMCIDELYGVGTEKEQVAVQNMQARNHAYDLFKWMGFAILVVVAILSVGLPLLKHVLFRGHGSITVIILITVIHLLLFVGSILYGKRSHAKGFGLLIAIGVLGLASLGGYITHVMRPLQGSNPLVWAPYFGLDCFLEIATGVIFTLMQVASYVMHINAWKRREMNQKMIKIGTIACVMVSVVYMVIAFYPYTQKSLYHELAQRVYEEDRATADVSKMSVGVNFGVANGELSYFNLTTKENIEEIFAILKDVKVTKGEPAKLDEEKARTCRIQFESSYVPDDRMYFFSDKDMKTMSWDVTIMESGEMWYRGNKYQIENEVDWNRLFKIAIREYDGANKELYEGLVE